MDDPQHQTSLNIPSLLVFAVLSFFTIRYLFFSTSSTNPSTSQLTGRGRMVPADRIEQVISMFPQVSRRDVEWDLLRNGMSIQATTERVLREGRLPAAPPNFRAQPSSADIPATTSTTNSSTSAGRSTPHKSMHPDLITRYNLASRVSGAVATSSEDENLPGKKKQGWSQNKVERQTLLAQRRDEMVLAARRKMEERERKGKDKAGA